MPKKVTKPVKKKFDFDHLFAVNILEKFIDFARNKLTPKLLDFSVKWLLKFGHFGLIAAAVLGFLFALLIAIRLDSFSVFLYGIAWIVLVFVVQYTARKFSTAGDTLINNNPTSLSSKAFLDCFGFLAKISGVIVLVVSIIWTIRGAGLSNLFYGIGIFILIEFLALVAFHPETTATKIVKEASAGQEALGIVVFFIKGFMRLIPIIFGIGVLVGLVLLFIEFIGGFGSVGRAQIAWENGVTRAYQILFVALIPLLSYLVFLFSYLVIDVFWAILAVPGKLEDLKKKIK